MDVLRLYWLSPERFCILKPMVVVTSIMMQNWKQSLRVSKKPLRNESSNNEDSFYALKVRIGLWLNDYIPKIDLIVI